MNKKCFSNPIEHNAMYYIHCQKFYEKKLERVDKLRRAQLGL